MDDVAYDLAPNRDVMAHFVVNDAEVHSLASVALYALVELVLQLNKHYNLYSSNDIFRIKFDR